MRSQIGRATRLLIIFSTLALMAVTAPSAQAQFEWQIEGKHTSEYEGEEVATTATAGTPLKLSIPWYATTITCNKLGSLGGAIHSGGVSEVTLNLTECVLSGPPFVVETCEVLEPVQLAIEGSLTEVGGDLFTLFSGIEEGAKMGAVAFKEGTECPLPSSSAVKGSFASTISREEVSPQPFIFGPAAEEALPGHDITFGGHAATFTGTVNVLAVAGKDWTGLATESSPEFRMNGSTFAELSIEGESALFVPETTTTITAPTSELEISCEEPGEGEANLYTGGTADMNIYFAGCSLQNSACTVYATVTEYENEENPGHVFLVGEGSTMYHYGRHYIVIEGSPLITFFLGGPFCFLPEENSIAGTVAFAGWTALEDLPEQPLAIADGKLAELLGTELEYATEPAYIGGGSGPAELFNHEPWGFE